MKEITDEQYKECDRAVALVEQKEKIDAILRFIRKKNSHLNFTLETKQKVNYVKEIFLPKEGGIITYFSDAPHPKKGFLFTDTVTKIDDIKKVLKSFLQGFSNTRGKIFLFLIAVFFRKSLEYAFWKLVWNLADTLEWHALKPERYCKAVREVHNAIEDESLRLVVCMLLEFDDAYRFRFQDAFGEMDKPRFAANPLHEVDRVFELLQKREIDPRLQQHWKAVRRLLFFLFWFKKPRQIIIDFCSRIEPANIAMDEADRYFATAKGEYTWIH